MSGARFKIVASGYRFCEAPRATRDGCVTFSDLIGGGLYRATPGGGVETLLAGRDWIGGTTVDRGGAMLCGGRGGLVLAKDGAATPVLSAIAGVAVAAVNDIEADASGAIYGGTIDFPAILERGEPPAPGLLFRLASGGEPLVLRDDVAASNGIGFSPDGATMYHAESTVGIWAWGMRDGVAAGPPALFAKADDCDGLAVDADGGVWVAFWAQAAIRRYRADATIDRTIPLPFPSVVSLSFGGPNGTDLYVATGGDAARPRAGGIVRLRTDVPGVPVHTSRFGGEG